METYKKVPFSHKIFTRFSKEKIFLVTKARTAEETAIADMMGNVCHIYKLEKDLGKRYIETPQYYEDGSLKMYDRDDSEHYDYTQVYNGKHNRLKRYDLDIDVIDGVLVFRLYVFYIKVVDGPEYEKPDAMEFARFCFKKGECWVEHMNGSVVDHGIGTVLTKRSFFYEILATQYSCDKSYVRGVIKALYPELLRYYKDQIFCYGDWFCPLEFIRGFLSMRRDVKIDKGVPEDIITDLNRLNDDMRGIMAGVTKDELGYKNDKLYAIHDSGAFMRIFIMTKRPLDTDTCFVEGLMCKYVLYVKQGSVYLFEKNYFEDKWSSSHKEYVINEALNETACSKIKVIGDERLADILDKHFGFENIDYTQLQFPVATMSLANRCLAAEQALKMGMYSVFNGGIQTNPSHGRQSIYPLFLKYKRKNFSEMFAKGSLGKRLMKTARAVDGLTYFQLEDVNAIFSSDDDIKARLRNAFKSNEDILLYLIKERSFSYAAAYEDYLRQVFAICEAFREEGKDAVAFFRAVLKRKKVDEAEVVVVNDTTDTPWHLIMLYSDYLSMIPDAQEYANAKGLGETFKKVLKPAGVRWAHDHAAEYQRLRAREFEMMEETELKKVFVEKTKEDGYASLERHKENEAYDVLIPQKAEQLITEGDKLHHCVAGYWKQVAAGKTKIVFVRKKDSLKEPFFTGEVRGGVLQQFYGIHNCTNKNSGLRSFIKKWASDNRIQIGCTV